MSAPVRVCGPEDVPLGEGRAVLLGGRRVAVFRTDVGWHAIDARCPHLGGPLADGIVAGGKVTCPLHERRFDLACGTGPDGMAVQAHAVEVRDDGVYVTVGVPVRERPVAA